MAAFFTRVENLFTQTIPADIKQYVPEILKYVDIIQQAIANPELDAILDSVLPTIAPEALAAIEAVLSTVATDLGIYINAETATDSKAKIMAIADQISTQPAALQSATLHALATHLTTAVSKDTTLTPSELSAYVAFAENTAAHSASAPSV